MTEPFVPFHRPSIGDEEIREVVETLRSGWLTTGPRAARFEQEFCEYVGSPHAIAVNSATAGLHLALSALGIGPGDEVITTPMTFCATVQAILHVGATPVLADVGRDGNIDPEQIERRIGSRTRAILPVHLAGLPCDMETIWSMARERGIHVVEDAAHAAGALYQGRRIGAGPTEKGRASDAVVFSFYATKNMTTGEGGMVACNSQSLADAIRMLALHGVSHDAWNRYTDDGDWHYDVLAHGFKYNLSDIQAAIGIHQLRKLDESIRLRAAYARIYNDAFAGLDELELPPDNVACRHAWHLYILRLNLHHLTIDRREFIRQLRGKSVCASVHFIPIPFFRFFSRLHLPEHPCQRAGNLYPRILSLPLYPAMTEAQVRYVARTVQQIVKSFSRIRLVA